MIIYNTTYHASLRVCDSFVEWLCTWYIPRAKADGTLRRPQLAQVLNDGTDADGYSYALQFGVDSKAELMKWYARVGKKLHEEMTRCFGRDVVGFTTLMMELDVE